MPIFDLAVFDRTLQPDDSEIASEFVSLVCVTVLSLLIGIKTYNVQFKYLSCSRWLIIALYLLSWAFTVSAAIFVSTNNGIPFFSLIFENFNSVLNFFSYIVGNYVSCFLSEMACDLFYSGTKMVIYSWYT